MKILIIGKGWLGTRLANELKGEKVVLSNKRLGELKWSDLWGYDVLINAGAKTNIDWCEQNKSSAYINNVDDAVYVANLCKQTDVRYIFISSACIFNSLNENDVKYEDSQPNPQCFYALTKWIAEELIRENNKDALIVRIRVPISEIPHERNTINKILKYDKLVDTEESVTVIEDFIPMLQTMIDTDVKSLTVHIVNKGTLTMPQIVSMFDKKFETINRQELGNICKKAGKAPRVSTIVGSMFNYCLPDIQERLPQIIENYKKNLLK